MQHARRPAKVTPFEFLQMLFVRFGIFVPIDLSIEKKFLGGTQYNDTLPTASADTLPMANGEAGNVDDDRDVCHGENKRSRFFFLPSLLGPGEPTEVWSYKCGESWKTTICHSLLLPEGAPPPGIMERIMALVLGDVYAAQRGDKIDMNDSTFPWKDDVGTLPSLQADEILCWRTAILLKLHTEEINPSDSSMRQMSVVEVFVGLVERNSPLCVASDLMRVGMYQLVLSANGQVGNGGKQIWNGGYKLVMKAVERVLKEYAGLEVIQHAVCPECLMKKAPSQARVWTRNRLNKAIQNEENTIRCGDGHRVPLCLVNGVSEKKTAPRAPIGQQFAADHAGGGVSVCDLLEGVVLVGLWCHEERQVVSAGSGFVVDRKRGLIVTAAHTLINIDDDKGGGPFFGRNYFGRRNAQVVVGVIPQNNHDDSALGMPTVAVFRYFAEIAAKDPLIQKKGICEVDACILRITSRMENDVGGLRGEGCEKQVQIVLKHDREAMKRENLKQLKCTEKCSIEENGRILGYNQGGEGLMSPGMQLNRYADFAKGYVCKVFRASNDKDERKRHSKLFQPREEIVLICSTIGGHSGGPCVNRQGEVIGILSRSDQVESRRCYLVPVGQWKSMLKEAKKKVNHIDRLLRSDALDLR